MDEVKRTCWPKYGRVDALVGLRGQQEPLNCLHTLTEFRMMAPRSHRKKILVQESKTRVVARKSKLVVRKRNSSGSNPLSERVSMTQKNHPCYVNEEDHDDLPLLFWAGDHRHNQNRFWK
jgi:hypothetical protein